jgi:antirestriction protein
MKVYVACLASYNNGKLHGEWVDATLGADHLRDEIKKVLATSPERTKDCPAEEWAIHDYDDFPNSHNLGEYPDIDELCEIAEFVEEHGTVARALLSTYDLDDSKKMMQDCYYGEHDSKEDFAEDFYHDCGYMDNIKDSQLAYYIDWELVARDLFINDFNDLDNQNGGIFVFSNL